MLNNSDDDSDNDRGHEHVSSSLRSPVLKLTIDNDWTCSDCSNVNFARRKSCNRCMKPKPMSHSSSSTKKRKLGHEIGKAAADKSRGLFSADDWQCNKCGNVNWARRQQCNVCNAPKFGEAEERTGFGGGYNDRGVVEYKDHEESDDEYDEFGRRKKTRFSDQHSTSSERHKREEMYSSIDKTSLHNDNSSINNTSVTDNGDDDDEDDDEDEDLSKYDLTNFDK